MTDNTHDKIEASFSTLIMSIGSSALMSLGLAPHPTSGKTEKNLEMARMNIDLLDVLKVKTKNNLTDDEQRFLEALLADLQIKFIQENKK